MDHKIDCRCIRMIWAAIGRENPNLLQISLQQLTYSVKCMQIKEKAKRKKKSYLNVQLHKYNSPTIKITKTSITIIIIYIRKLYTSMLISQIFFKDS